MRKLKVLLSIMVILLSLNVGATHKSKNEINNECRAFGFDFGVVRWGWKQGWVQRHWVPLGDSWETSVTGTLNVATWDVGSIDDFGATGIVVKAGKKHYSVNGTNSTITEAKTINSITFCFSPVPCAPLTPPPPADK